MAAPAGCRFFGPIAIVLCGPLVLSGSAAEPIRHAADQPIAAAVSSRDDAEDAGAEELVRAALKAEAAGNSAEREKLLRRALKNDPECAPARWHLGYVRAGKEWVKWDELQRRAAGDPRIAEYRRRFDELAGAPAGELALARWCRDQGLEDHARTHWARLLSFEPQNEEALKALGVRWHQGRLLTHEEIVAARRGESPESADGTRQRTARKDWNKHWTPQVTKWQRMIRENNPAVDSAIREEMQSVKKSSEADLLPAMQALNATLITRSQRKKDEAEYRALSLKWIAVLDGMQEHPATLSLAWQAVDHPMPEVRAAAADALKKRPKETYVPILLARMRSPVEAEFLIQPSFGSGSVTSMYTFYQEGPVADRSLTRVQVRGVRPLRALTGSPSAVTASAVGRTRQALASALRVHQVVGAANASINDLNGRVRAALVRATGTDCGETASSWWKWYDDYHYAHYDLQKPSSGDKEKLRREHSIYTISYIRSCSCFPRGTVVWTLTGPAAIEKINVGDRVLSQHPVTGELAYKPGRLRHNDTDGGGWASDF